MSDVLRVLSAVLLLGNVEFVEGAVLELDVVGNNGRFILVVSGPLRCVEINLLFQYYRVRCSSVVEHLFMVRWVVGSIPHDVLIEIFLIPASAPWLV